ncbi:hypothetical protein CEXT_484401 [Caerostris extrusa]|uniref:C2H2-type domain-containing protein n=1 Tax=Caerostris extrusa TaxID=172846 RepID=A0AAV4Y453_CAEEX|nr:hypothetical protein CEXT_484401 [Caerostris extrusa]
MECLGRGFALKRFKQLKNGQISTTGTSLDIETPASFQLSPLITISVLSPGYVTSRSGDMTRHLRIHTYASIISSESANHHQCPACGYITSRSGDMTRHLRIHTCEKPFQCSICSKASPRKLL